ncbi:MAG: YqcI/YcgG family protein, partial [Pseudomonadota bacterium]|nr:YqcI/YcgG family protein [Pseudomonadota bacterium]
MQSVIAKCPFSLYVPPPATNERAPSANNGALTAHFLDFIAGPTFPCVGSKAALARDAIQVHEFTRLGARSNDSRLLDLLSDFADKVDAIDPTDTTVHSFVALFEGPVDT